MQLRKTADPAIIGYEEFDQLLVSDDYDYGSSSTTFFYFVISVDSKPKLFRCNSDYSTAPELLSFVSIVDEMNTIYSS